MIGLIVRRVGLLVLALVFLVPFYLVVVNAFKTKADVLRDPLGLPLGRMTLDNIVDALTRPSFQVVEAYATSFTITILSVIGVLVTSAGIAYVIARERRRSVRLLQLLLVAGLMVPPQVVLIPVVKLLGAVNLMFTIPGLVLFNIGFYLPFATFIYIGYVRTVPRELDEAAALDGAGRIRTLASVVLPLMRPATTTLFVLLFIFVWNDFVGPQLILGAGRSYTVTTGLYRAVGQFSTDWSLVFAYALIVSIPVIALYAAAQGRIVAGLTAGATKG